MTYDHLPAAFVLSSGTVGAALSSALSKVRSVAISYGTVLHPTPTAYFEPAHRLGSNIIAHLWENWGVDEGGLRQGEVDLYSVNVPMIEGLLKEPGLTICWTRIWRNSYGKLFKAHTDSKMISAAGPDALEVDRQGTLDEQTTAKDVGGLVFKFGPDLGGIMNPAASDVPIGTDGWAIQKGWVSVTPLRATFAEPIEWSAETEADLEPRVWKMKL